MPEAEVAACPEAECTAGTSHGPNKDETSVPADVPDILESSWMTGQELGAFAEFLTCSGMRAEIAELTTIKVDLSGKRGVGTGAAGKVQGEAREITISGANTMDAILQGMSQLTQEIGAREEALTGASSRNEGIGKAQPPVEAAL